MSKNGCDRTYICAGFNAEATAEEWATLTQNCRRCCHNYQRASMEMVQAWEAGGTIRKELLKRWWANSNVATVTAEIVFSELHMEPGAQIHITAVISLCLKFAIERFCQASGATPCTQKIFRSIAFAEEADAPQRFSDCSGRLGLLPQQHREGQGSDPGSDHGGTWLG